MTRPPPDENAKNKEWKTPMDMDGTTPEKYPECEKADPAGKASATSKGAGKTAHQHGRSG